MTNNEEIYTVLASVMDPEIPVLSVVDLGMITDVQTSNDGVTVKMIPTFVACPAINVIKTNIKDSLEHAGFLGVNVELDETIAWSSDRISENGKLVLEKFGLGAPVQIEGILDMKQIETVACPHCGSDHTTLVSVFGSTLCRSIHFCNNCKQGFERFKPL